MAEQVKEQLDARAESVPTEVEARCRTLAYQDCFGLIREDLRSFGIEFQSWFSEASLRESQAVERALDELKSATPVRAGRGLVVSSVHVGDEKDRVVKKQDGEYTYFASDIAYHHDKLEAWI